MDDTGALIRDEGGLIAEVRALRREVERLKRAGYAKELGAPSPGGLLTPAQAARIASAGNAEETLAGLAANSLLGRVGPATAGSVPVTAQSVLGRAGSNLTSFAASALEVLARTSSGDLDFQDRDTMLTEFDLLAADKWQTQAVSADTTLSLENVVAVLTNTSDITITMPTPTTSTKLFVVTDPLGAMSGSSRVRFDAVGTGRLNGSAGATSYFNSQYGTWLFFGVPSAGQGWWSYKLI